METFKKVYESITLVFIMMFVSLKAIAVILTPGKKWALMVGLQVPSTVEQIKKGDTRVHANTLKHRMNNLQIALLVSSLHEEDTIKRELRRLELEGFSFRDQDLADLFALFKEADKICDYLSSKEATKSSEEKLKDIGREDSDNKKNKGNTADTPKTAPAKKSVKTTTKKRPVGRPKKVTKVVDPA